MQSPGPLSNSSNFLLPLQNCTAAARELHAPIHHPPGREIPHWSAGRKECEPSSVGTQKVELFLEDCSKNERVSCNEVWNNEYNLFHRDTRVDYSVTYTLAFPWIYRRRKLNRCCHASYIQSASHSMRYGVYWAGIGTNAVAQISVEYWIRLLDSTFEGVSENSWHHPGLIILLAVSARTFCTNLWLCRGSGVGSVECGKGRYLYDVRKMFGFFYPSPLV